MINHPKDMRLKAYGTRTRCQEGAEPQAVDITVGVRWSPSLNSFWLWIDKGAVTGFESIRVIDIPERIENNGWGACAGTPGSWDQLEVSAANMKAIYEWIAANPILVSPENCVEDRRALK